MRIPHWESLLADCIEDAKETPFEWSVHDCVMWALRVRAALLGIPFEKPPGFDKYKTAKGALAAMKRKKFETLVDAGKDFLGEPLPFPLMAQRGDLAVARPFGGAVVSEWQAFGGAACVVGLNGSLYAPGSDPDGLDSLVELPLEAAIAAWRV